MATALLAGAEDFMPNAELDHDCGRHGNDVKSLASSGFQRYPEREVTFQTKVIA